MIQSLFTSFLDIRYRIACCESCKPSTVGSTTMPSSTSKPNTALISLVSTLPIYSAGSCNQTKWTRSGQISRTAWTSDNQNNLFFASTFQLISLWILLSNKKSSRLATLLFRQFFCELALKIPQHG